MPATDAQNNYRMLWLHNDIHDFSKQLYFSSHGDLCRWCFTVQLVCLWIDIDHSKFQPCSVNHHGAVRRAHCRRHKQHFFSCVKCMRPGLLVQVQPEILQNGIGDKNFVQIKMYYVTSRRGGRCVLPRIAVIANQRADERGVLICLYNFLWLSFAFPITFVASLKIACFILSTLNGYQS